MGDRQRAEAKARAYVAKMNIRELEADCIALQDACLTVAQADDILTGWFERHLADAIEAVEDE